MTSHDDVARDSGIGTPIYAYVLASILGIVLPLAARVIAVLAIGKEPHGFKLPFTSYLVFTQFAVLPLTEMLLGLAFGYAWPGTGWKWGLWLIPLFFIWMVGGGGSIVAVVIMVVGGCAGGFAGARVRNLVELED